MSDSAENNVDKFSNQSPSQAPPLSIEEAKKKVADLMADALGRNAGNYLHIGTQAIDALILAVSTPLKERITELEAKVKILRALGQPQLRDTESDPRGDVKQSSMQPGGEGTRVCVNHEGFSGFASECPACNRVRQGVTE